MTPIQEGSKRINESAEQKEEGETHYRSLAKKYSLTSLLDNVGEVISDAPTFIVAHADDKQVKVAHLEKEKDKDGGTMIVKYSTIVLDAIPTEIIVIYDPQADLRKYVLKLEAPDGTRFTYGPLEFTELVNEIARSPLAFEPRNLQKYLGALLRGYEKERKVVHKIEIERQGFFFVDGKLVPSKVDVRQVNAKQALDAVEALEKLRARFYSSEAEQTRLAHLVKLAVVAPFDFARRQMGYANNSNFIPGIDLAGRPDTGKTYGYGRLFLAMYRLPFNDNYLKGAGTVGTQPRYILHTGHTTMPVICDEMDFLTEWRRRDEVRGYLEMLKNGRSMTNPRDTLTRDSKLIERPSCAYTILTHNSDAIDEDGFAKRYTLITLTEKDIKDKQKMDEFSNFFVDNQEEYATIGDFAIWYIMNNTEVLKQDWVTISNNVLGELHKLASVEYPAWLDAVIINDSREDISDNRRMMIRTILIEEINRCWSLNRMMENYNDLKERVSLLLAQDLLPFAKGHHEKGVCLLSSFVDKLKEKGLERISMKQLADLTGFKLEPVWLFDHTYKAVTAPLDHFIAFLSLNHDNKEQTTSQQQQLPQNE
jgi:hypothetical protein